jgi:O-antigen ligase
MTRNHKVSAVIPARNRPLGGYGYDGFWTVRHVIMLSRMFPWAPGEAHSMCVDSLLDLGTVGALALALILFWG